MRKCFFGRSGPFGIVFAAEHFGIKDRLASGIDAVLFDDLLCLGFLAGHELERGPGSLAVLPGAWHEPRTDIAYGILIARTFDAGISHDITNLRFRRIGESRIVFGGRDDHGNFSLLHGEVELVPAVIRYSLGAILCQHIGPNLSGFDGFRVRQNCIWCLACRNPAAAHAQPEHDPAIPVYIPFTCSQHGDARIALFRMIELLCVFSDLRHGFGWDLQAVVREQLLVVIQDVGLSAKGDPHDLAFVHDVLRYSRNEIGVVVVRICKTSILQVNVQRHDPARGEKHWIHLVVGVHHIVFAGPRRKHNLKLCHVGVFWYEVEAELYARLLFQQWKQVFQFPVDGRIKTRKDHLGARIGLRVAEYAYNCKHGDRKNQKEPLHSCASLSLPHADSDN